MNVIRLHGKLSPMSGIVYIRNKFGSSTWVVNFDTNEPNNLKAAKLVRQVCC